jgi:hypothetical protein
VGLADGAKRQFFVSKTSFSERKSKPSITKDTGYDVAGFQPLAH